MESAAPKPSAKETEKLDRAERVHFGRRARSLMTMNEAIHD